MNHHQVRLVFLAIAAALGFMAGVLTLPQQPEIRALFGIPTVETWEHGLRTERVIATRYKDSMFGYMIGFDYPKNIYNSDRIEVFEYLNAQQGAVIQGGGAPGAITYVHFKGVTDQASANAKLRQILPDLDRLLASLGDDADLAYHAH